MHTDEQRNEIRAAVAAARKQMAEGVLPKKAKPNPLAPYTKKKRLTTNKV